MSRRGSTFIEAAFVMILFAALSAAGFRVVKQMAVIHEMETAVRAGARAGARHPLPNPDDPQFRAVVVSEVIKAAPRVSPSDVVIETRWIDGSIQDVRVSVKGYRNVANYPWTGPNRNLSNR